jgi:hypothetical protein
LFRDEKQISNYNSTGYLYTDTDEENAANSYDFYEISDTEVERYFMIYGTDPPMTKRFKIAADCPLIEREGVDLLEDCPAWERKVRDINRSINHVISESWWMARGWLGEEGVCLRKSAFWSGPWREMYLTAPPVNRVVVTFD